jgi:pilus assembly protein CpaE
MLGLAILTSNPLAAGGIEQLARESNVFKLVFRATPIPAIPEVIRGLRTHDPDIVLLDLTDWDSVAAVARQIKSANIRGVIIGFRYTWSRADLLNFEEAGVIDVLREPFSNDELETKAFEALHRERSVNNQNLVAFLPAKAGGGCSTVALHAAAALASTLDKKVLLIDTDRRSGVLGIMLNKQNRTGISEALQQAGSMTPGEWVQHCIDVYGLSLLLANPARPGPLPSWGEYYQLLRFVEQRYGFVVADMPELVNAATAEVVRSARGVFVVCTPDIPSLMLATQRRAEVASFGLSKDKVHFILNRWEKRSLPLEVAEKILGQPVFATLPSETREARKAQVESRLMSPDSGFAKSCRLLGRKLTGLPDAEPWQFKFSLLRHLGRAAEH